jgi:hypothetical protein
LVPARFSEGENAALSGCSDQTMTRPKSVPAVGAAPSRSWTSTGRGRHDPSRRSVVEESTGRFVEQVSQDGGPSRLIGAVVFWVIMLFVISSAIGTLNIPALTGS